MSLRELAERARAKREREAKNTDCGSVADRLDDMAERVARPRPLNSTDQVFTDGKAEGLRIAAQTVRDIGARNTECRSVAYTAETVREYAECVVEAIGLPANEREVEAVMPLLLALARVPTTEQESVSLTRADIDRLIDVWAAQVDPDVWAGVDHDLFKRLEKIGRDMEEKSKDQEKDQG